MYKAIDKNHHLYDNYVWTGKLPGPPPQERLRSGMPVKRTKSVYVALKRIYVTSSPARILNELEIMEDLRDCQHVAYLISAFRTQDQIVAVMPYSRHADFRVSKMGRGQALASHANDAFFLDRNTTASCLSPTSNATSGASLVRWMELMQATSSIETSSRQTFSTIQEPGKALYAILV